MMEEPPPVEPGDEPQVPEDADFLASCRAALDGLPMTKEWKLGSELLTRGEPWGLIWRADFKMPGPPSEPLINRIVCWKEKKGDTALMIAIGQRVAPL